MPARNSFDAELAALQALRGARPRLPRPELTRALKQRNNYLAAKAAELVLHHQLAELQPELAAAFVPVRFLPPEQWAALWLS